MAQHGYKKWATAVAKQVNWNFHFLLSKKPIELLNLFFTWVCCDQCLSSLYWISYLGLGLKVVHATFCIFYAFQFLM